MPRRKRNVKKTLTIAGVMYTLLFAGAGAGITGSDDDTKCGGEERWAQKVLIDDEAEDVDRRPQITTIENLNAISTDTIKIVKSTERNNLEMHTYKIEDCFITRAVREDDNDIHLVIEDGKGNHMIAEIPDPDCPEARKSKYWKDFRKALKTFLRYKDIYNRHRFDVTGVLFIDKKHSTSPTGNANNNIELHPVLNLTETSNF